MGREGARCGDLEGFRRFLRAVEFSGKKVWEESKLRSHTLMRSRYELDFEWRRGREGRTGSSTDQTGELPLPLSFIVAIQQQATMMLSSSDSS